MIRAVFFDIGKTLVDDPFPKAKHVVGKFLVQNNVLKSSNLSAFQKTLTLQNSRMDSYQFSHYLGEEAIFASAMSEYEINDDILVKKALVAYRQEVRRLYQTDPSLKSLSNKELARLLSWLRDEKCLILGIISDERMDSIALYWDILECGNFFSVVVTSEEAGCRKPYNQIFRYALEKAQVNAEESLFIGDSPGRDIAGAKDVGMTAVLFTKFANDTIGAGHDYVISDLRELKSIVETLIPARREG